MKNSNGSVRRNFFRSSSRRLRVGPASGTPTGANGAGGPQQSLMASRQAIKREQQQLSPMEASEQLLSQQQQQQQGRQHNSPSEFGGSSSGGFTYFSGELLRHPHGQINFVNLLSDANLFHASFT